jgi:SAM-dependent methyltransferase
VRWSPKGSSRKREPTVDLRELLVRDPPEPWTHGGKIPWNEPGFSARMLKEHLSQDHDLASRRTEKIDAQVEWLEREVLPSGSSVLDLGCGPGLYASRLAARGHRVVGIDFSPASIEYARAESEASSLSCSYILGNLLDTEFGTGHDAVLFLYGEFNTFQRDEARQLLGKAREALKPGGRIVLELHTEEQVKQLGTDGPSWYVSQSGLFADEPHLCLIDRAWDDVAMASAERFTVFRVNADGPETYVCSTQAYSDREYEEVLAAAGFSAVRRRNGPADAGADTGGGLLMMTAEVPRAQGGGEWH